MRVPRYKGLSCGRTFSAATGSANFRERKRNINKTIFQVMVSGVSQRRAAFLILANRKTVVRKFIRMGKNAQRALPAMPTKKTERLGYHVALYSIYHNLFLIQKDRKKINFKFLGL